VEQSKTRSETVKAGIYPGRHAGKLYLISAVDWRCEHEFSKKEEEEEEEEEENTR
jgi:hypothetical protein